MKGVNFVVKKCVIFISQIEEAQKSRNLSRKFTALLGMKKRGRK